jgi:hypothetical protein
VGGGFVSSVRRFEAVESLSSCFETSGEERVVEGDPKLKGIPVVASE